MTTKFQKESKDLRSHEYHNSMKNKRIILGILIVLGLILLILVIQSISYKCAEVLCIPAGICVGLFLARADNKNFWKPKVRIVEEVGFFYPQARIWFSWKYIDGTNKEHTPARHYSDIKVYRNGAKGGYRNKPHAQEIIDLYISKQEL